MKCFLFLDAVDADSHPMKIIRGTHDNVYYSYKERSFEESFARAQGEEVRLTGGAGDGYCFDTNAIHCVRNRHRHAIEQASRRWRGGRRE